MNWYKLAKSPTVTPDIDKFAEWAVIAIMEMKAGDPYEQPVYSDSIRTKDGYVGVTVVVYPSQGGRLADVMTPSWWKHHNPEDSRRYYRCFVRVYVDIPVPDGWQSKLKLAIIHEIVHCLDPKLNKEELFQESWHEKHRKNIDRPGYTSSKEYYTAPWEQDARMSSETWTLVQVWKRNDIPLSQVLDNLRNYEASGPIELTYRDDPKLWKRYMRAMYDAVQGVYADEIKQ